MTKRRKLLAAGIVRDYRFANKRMFELHCDRLDSLKKDYAVMEICRCEDGTVLARIVEQYNNTPLIQLYED